MNRPLKIHFPLLGFNLSGGVRVIIRLANGLVKLGHEVRITVPASRSLPPFPLDPRVQLAALGKPAGTRIGAMVRLGLESAGWGDVLVATGFKTPFLLGFSRTLRRRKTPILYLVQGYEPVTHIGQGILSRMNRRLAHRSYFWADERLYVSHFIAEKVGLDKEPKIVSPGIDPSVFFPVAREFRTPLRVGVIAHHRHFKGFDLFLDALSRLSDIRPRIEVQILETEKPRQPFPEGVHIQKISDDRQLGDFYRHLDIFVFPSRMEGFGLPPLEAMACGCCAVISDCGGVREYARGDENCLLAPAGSSEAIASAIRRLVDHKDLLTSLARKGLETASRFTWDQTVESFERQARCLFENHRGEDKWQPEEK